MTFNWLTLEAFSPIRSTSLLFREVFFILAHPKREMQRKMATQYYSTWFMKLCMAIRVKQNLFSAITRFLSAHFGMRALCSERVSREVITRSQGSHEDVDFSRVLEILVRMMQTRCLINKSQMMTGSLWRYYNVFAFSYVITFNRCFIVRCTIYVLAHLTN